MCPAFFGTKNVSGNAAESHLKQTAFTLVELLVVIAITAVLLSVLIPALRKAKQSAQSIVCRNHLRTLALANEAYAALWDNWYVPVIDTTMTPQGQPTWNSNVEFRQIVGLEDASGDSGFKMPKEYLCPADEQSDEDYWQSVSATYQNYVSFGYNLTDWGPNAETPATWSGNIPTDDWACRFRVGTIQSTARKIMFVDAGDWAVYMSGADYKMYWDRHGQNIVQYRDVGMWYPVYYRHREGANIAWFDGHVDFQKKEQLFYYAPPESIAADQRRNEIIWFCDLSRRNLE